MKKILLISLMFSEFCFADDLCNNIKNAIKKYRSNRGNITLTKDQINQMTKIQDEIRKAIRNMKNNGSFIKDTFEYLEKWFIIQRSLTLEGHGSCFEVGLLFSAFSDNTAYLFACSTKDYEKIIDKILEYSNKLYNGKYVYYKDLFSRFKEMYGVCRFHFAYSDAIGAERVRYEDCAMEKSKIILNGMIESFYKGLEIFRANHKGKIPMYNINSSKVAFKYDARSIKILGEEVIFFVNSIFNEGLVLALIGHYIHCNHDPNLQKEQKERCDKYIDSLKDATLNKICYMKKLSGSDKDAFSMEYSRYFDKCYEAIKNNYYSHRG